MRRWNVLCFSAITALVHQSLEAVIKFLFRIFGTRSKYKCAQCAVFFYSFRNLESHVNLNHLRVEESTLSYRWSIFTCEVCLRIFSRPENYYRHMKEKHGVRRDYFAEDFASIDLKYAWQQVCEEKEKLIDAAKYSGYITARKATKKGLFYCKVQFSWRRVYLFWK